MGRILTRHVPYRDDPLDRGKRRSLGAQGTRVALALIRAGQLYAWRGPSLLVVNTRGECGHDEPLSGFYFREARFLQTLRLTVNGQAPWLCESTLAAPHVLAFTWIYPELTEFGGGGSGQSEDSVSTDAAGIPHRALSLRAVYTLSVAGFAVTLTISNHATRRVEADVAWYVDADYADIQEAHGGRREQQADVDRTVEGHRLCFTYQHRQLKYRTIVTPIGSAPWSVRDSMLQCRIQLDPQAAVTLRLQVEPSGSDGEIAFHDGDAREHHLRNWQEQLTRVA